MRVKNIFYSILTLCLIMFSCKAVKNKEKVLQDSDLKVSVIKFMGTVYSYPVEVDERIFWGAKDEHVIYQFPESHHIIDEVKTLPKNDGKTFEFLTYAFIVKSKTSIDTIYVDQKLTTWKLVKKGKSTYFYDESRTIKESLQNRYSFFNECW